MLKMLYNWIYFDQLIQHTTRIAKFRVSFDAHFCVDRWTSLVEKIPFLQYHQDTTGALPRHHGNTQNMSKTWAKHPKHHRTPPRHYTTDTPPKCHQDTNDHRNKIDRQPRNQNEGHNQFPKGTAKGFPQKVVASIFCDDIFSPSPSSRMTINTTPSQQHHHSTIITIIIIITIITTIIFIFDHLLFTNHAHNINIINNKNNNNNIVIFYFWQISHDMGVMRRQNGQVFFHFFDRWPGDIWSNLTRILGPPGKHRRPRWEVAGHEMGRRIYHKRWDVQDGKLPQKMGRPRWEVAGKEMPQMTRDLCVFLFFPLCRGHGSLRFLGMSDYSHVTCKYYNILLTQAFRRRCIDADT